MSRNQSLAYLLMRKGLLFGSYTNDRLATPVLLNVTRTTGYWFWKKSVTTEEVAYDVIGDNQIINITEKNNPTDFKKGINYLVLCYNPETYDTLYDLIRVQEPTIPCIDIRLHTRM